MRKFTTQEAADRFADRLDAEGLDPYVEQEGDVWVVYFQEPHWDDK